MRWGGLLLLLMVVPAALWWPFAPRIGPGAGSGGGFAAVDEFVAERLTAARLPGAALAVVRDGRVVHVRGFGHTGGGGPVTPASGFRIASLTKAFTATAVLRLVEAGRVRLDAPVTDYLPGFRVADPRGGRITVRHLLNQTSGLADTGFPEQTMPPPADLSGRVVSLRAARMVSAPGTRFHYFNPNYDVLARVVEVVTGRPYETALRTTIFEPLGMRGTSVVLYGRGPRGAPPPENGHVLVYGVAVARPELDGFLGGEGSVVSTADDMARWLVVQSTGEYAGRRLLTPASLELMRTPPPGVAGTAYGMGWTAERAPDGSARLTHNGVLSTYYAEASLDRASRGGVVLLFNSGNALAPYHAIMQGVTAILDGRRAEPGLPFAAIELPLTWLTILVLMVRGRRLVRFRAWAARRRGDPVWRHLLVLPWLFAPAVLLAALPALTAAFSGRVFGQHQLLRAMPSVYGLLGAAALTGLVLAGCRVAFAVRRPRGPRADALDGGVRQPVR
ncbi:serine hydrolase [Sphaerisporangium rufum]|uniref:Serine hydrolase n=2 Tax=Sphaerisporangium rufum TaxID=1381558 RepID=A0A919UX43_9ACTN|nr:serine hydrolase [Sphaerisporangium rufum]